MKKIILYLIAGIAAFSLAACEKAEKQEPEEGLRVGYPFSLEASLQDYERFGPDELNGQYDGILYYDGASDVRIMLEDQWVPFEEAVRDGKCHVEEVIASARMDARNGLCTEGQCTYNGLTQFTYTYQDYMLVTVHDVYEVPNGKEYIINTFTVTTPKELQPEPIGYHNRETGEYLDLEDWGIAFSPVKVDSNGITVETEQSGGQQFGSLNLVSFYLVKEPEVTMLPETQVYGLNIPIQMEGTGSFDLEWNEPMEAGSYTLVVQLQEQYNKEDVPSLLRNYHDNQQYLIPIVIE